jgi:DNA-directed RNA polymerase subunit RPC12/RpoP
MRACPKCGDLSNPLAIFCETAGCGAQLVPTKVALAELRAVRGKTVKRGRIARCPYCGQRVRGYCTEHGSLDRELYGTAA